MLHFLCNCLEFFHHQDDRNGLSLAKDLVTKKNLITPLIQIG